MHEEEKQAVLHTIPAWLHDRDDLCEADTQLYAFLLKLRAALCRPGRNGLVIPLKTTGKEFAPKSADPGAHLRLGLETLAQTGIIQARKLDYPPSVPECWEIGFPKEERL